MITAERGPAFALAVAAALAVQLALGEQDVFLPVVLGLILVFGMPHGALDLALARSLWPLETLGRHMLFLALYLASAAVVLAVWMLSPALALVAFLAYSAVHFSEDWPAPKAGAIAAATLVLALPAAFHPERVDLLFARLGADGDLPRDLLLAAGAMAACLTLWVYRRQAGALASIAVLAALAALLSPLLYFFVYFCGLHGPGHVRRVRASLGLSRRGIRREILPPTLFTFAGLLLGGTALLAAGTTFSDTAMKTTFIAFAALTVPHMLLVDRFSR
jgi:Brp/Blh family beta-carotene 15,15'-monooxygenase